MKKLFSLLYCIIKPFRIQTNVADNEVNPNLNDNSGKTKFYLNDPSTPHLVGEQEPPSETCFPTVVKDDIGPGYPLGSIHQQASACKTVIGSLLSYIMVLYKLTNLEKRPNSWATKRPLTVVPRAGMDLNAYYDRNSLKFFHYKTPEKMVYACDSTPVVCHEFGHAFLDALRPDFWSTQAFEVWAYHESFGDICSVISSFQNEKLIEDALQETNGNLLHSNVITRVGSEMGSVYYKMLKEKNGVSPDCLRDISVVYKYKNPEQLPKKGRDDELIYESHNFSRVFTGAFYEICVKVSLQLVSDGTCKNITDSLKLSRDICFRYLLKATALAPITVKMYEAIAKQMLLADRENGSKFQEVIKEVFLSRQIIDNKIFAQSGKKLEDIRIDLKSESYSIESFSKEKVLRTLSTKSVKILDKRVLSLTNNHLYGLEIDIPSQTSYFFNERDELIDIVGASENDVIDCAISCLNYLDKNKLIGNHQEALFHVKHAKILRSRIRCKCGLPNYCDPNAPEFNKPWKPANHSSCCGCTGPSCQPRSCECKQTPLNNEKKSYCASKLASCFSNKHSVGQFLKRKFCS